MLAGFKFSFQFRLPAKLQQTAVNWLARLVASSLADGRLAMVAPVYRGFEYISADFPLQKGTKDLPKRLIYAEIFELDSALISES